MNPLTLRPQVLHSTHSLVSENCIPKLGTLTFNGFSFSRAPFLRTDGAGECVVSCGRLQIALVLSSFDRSISPPTLRFQVFYSSHPLTSKIRLPNRRRKAPWFSVCLSSLKSKKEREVYLCVALLDDSKYI
jgi:hypothetical protein